MSQFFFLENHQLFILKRLNYFNHSRKYPKLIRFVMYKKLNTSYNAYLRILAMVLDFTDKVSCVHVFLVMGCQKNLK